MSSLANLATFAIGIVIALIVLIYRKKQFYLLFAIGVFCISGWGIAKYFSFMLESPLDLIFMRMSIAAASFIPVLYFHFTSYFVELKKVWVIKYIYAIAVFFSLLSFTPLMVPGIRIIAGNKALYPGPVYIVFLMYFAAFLFLGMANLYKGLKSPAVLKSNQIKYLLIASSSGFAGGIIVFLSNFYSELSAVGEIFIMLFTVVCAYAILKHHLLDISIVIRRGLVYSVLTLLISGIYFLMLLLLRDFAADLVPISPVWLSLLLVLVFVFLFQPVKDRLQSLLDRLFYKEKIDLDRKIIELSQETSEIIEGKKLISVLQKSIKKIFHLGSAAIYMKDQQTGKYLDLEMNVLDNEKTQCFSPDLDLLFISGSELLLPIFFKQELLGVLHVKDKLSGESFSLSDIELLRAVLNQAVPAIKNAYLVNQIIEKERELYRSNNLALLGTIAAGITHEIKNPLAAIKGMVQIIPDKLEDQEFIKKLVSIVPSQIDRIHNTVESLLKIGKQGVLNKERIKLDKLLEDLVSFLKFQFKKKNIEIKTEFRSRWEIFGDYNSLYQAFFNLFQNSAQAIDKGGKIIVRILPESAAVEIEDTGAGIPQSMQKDLFNPFNSSKIEGAGLGLFMVKKILADHKAKISFKTKEGKGTVFRVDFGNFERYN